MTVSIQSVNQEVFQVFKFSHSTLAGDLTGSASLDLSQRDCTVIALHRQLYRQRSPERCRVESVARVSASNLTLLQVECIKHAIRLPQALSFEFSPSLSRASRSHPVKLSCAKRFACLSILLRDILFTAMYSRAAPSHDQSIYAHCKSENEGEKSPSRKLTKNNKI